MVLVLVMMLVLVFCWCLLVLLEPSVVASWLWLQPRCIERGVSMLHIQCH